MLTRKQIEQNIEAMEQQGASPVEIQGYLDGLGSQQSEKPGLVKGTVQAVAKPFAAGLSSFAPAVEAAMGVSQDEIARRNTEGRDWGWFGGKVRPLTSFAEDAFTEAGKDGKTTPKEFAIATARGVAGAVGSSAEAASMAVPFKASMGAGFWKSAVQGMKSAPALTFGIGTGLQEFGETGSVGKGAATAAVDTVGSGIAFGIFNKGGQIMQKFGSRLLAKETTQMLSSEIKNLSEKIYGTMGEALRNKGLTLDDIKTSAQFKETYRGFQNSFNESVYKGTQNLLEDSRVAYGGTSKEVVMRDLTQNVKREINGFFELPKATYQQLDQSGFQFTDFPKTYSTFNPDNIKTLSVDDLLKSRPELDGAIKAMNKSGLTPTEIATELQIDTPSSGAFDSFMSGVMEKLKGGQLGARDLLNTAYSLFGINDRTIKRFTPEEQGLARSVGASIFADAEEQLVREGRTDLLNLWKTGATQWQQALRISESNTLNNLAEAGNIDNFISKLVDSTGELTLDEKGILDKILTENPLETEKLFVNGIVDRVEALIKPARGQMPSPESLAEGSKFIDKFLEKRGVFPWADNIMSPETAEYLRLTSSFMKTDFDSALSKMKQMSGGIPEDEQFLMETILTKGKLDIAEAIKKSDFTQFGDSFVNLIKKHPEEMKPYVEKLSDTERKVAGISLTHRLFEESKVISYLDEMGKFKIDETFEASLLKTYDELIKLQLGTGEKNIYGLIDSKVIDGMDKIVQNISKKKLIDKMEPLSLRPFIDLAMGGIYTYSRWFPGAQLRFQQAFGDVPDQKAIKTLVKDEVERFGQKNGFIRIGDFLQIMAKFAPVPIQTQEIVTGDNNNE